MASQAGSNKTTAICLVVAFSCFGLWAQDKVSKPATEPELTSLFPLGGSLGTRVEVEIRGERLDGANAIWFGDEGLKAQIIKVEEIELSIPAENTQGRQEVKRKSVTGHSVRLRLEIDPRARIGAHRVRVVSPRGISKALTFWVHSDPVISETKNPHGLPDEAQKVSVPVVVSGKIGQEGEVDSYEFEALQGQECVFETAGTARPALYEVTGSWFDPNRVVRMDFEEHLLPLYQDRSEPQLTYRFQTKGRYLAKMQGGDQDAGYLLRIAPADEATPRYPVSSWQERNFSRKIEPEWIRRIRARSLVDSSGQAGRQGTDGASAAGFSSKITGEVEAPAATPPVVRVKEPDETVPSIPVILEGAVDRPGDVDRYRFRADRGQRLAFEIETPATTYPYFNPRLRVLDEEGQEVLSNVYKRVPRTTMIYWKSPEAKTIHTFDEGGEYTLHIGDITSRHGDAGFRYRVLIRSQIPHVGEIRVIEYWERMVDTEIDRINLVPGEAKRLTVVTHREEGFTEDIAIAVENLPPGVQVIPATRVDDRGGPPQDQGRKERFMPESQEAVILIAAGKEAPATVSPQWVRLVVRPVPEGRVARYVKFGGEAPLKPIGVGQVGKSLPVLRIPLMVIRKDVGAQSGAP